ncbi:MAG: hypothetical protein HYU70_09205 [Bacteroidetes bacterium]|nr:hypothetical protein [Bacteroidota bacterium]
MNRFIILSILLLVECSRLSGQATNKIDTVGNVGIGTISPAVKLDLGGDFRMRNPAVNGSSYTTFRIQGGISLEHGLEIDFFGDPGRGDGVGTYYAGYGGGAIVNVNARPLVLGTANLPRMMITGDGMIGIGTTSPNLGQLHISGNANSVTTPNRPRIALEDLAGNSQWLIQPWSATGGDGNFSILRNSGVGNIVLGGSGINVGIGTNFPAEKLSVNGNIKAKKLIITPTGWSDYVFDKDYKLRSLSSLEAFIKENKHLPEVPSANEVEEKGISVGDNQALLLKKIEELTLYIISQQKQIDSLTKKIRKK